MSFRNKVIWELYPETHSISDEPVGVLDKNNNMILLAWNFYQDIKKKYHFFVLEPPGRKKKW